MCVNEREVLNLGDLFEYESLIEQYFQEDNKEVVVQLLVKLIVKNVCVWKFDQVERLCEKLFKVDFMVVNEIVMIGEVIEKEKSNVIDKVYMSNWIDFYGGLMMEEINVLYYGMKLEKRLVNDMIYKQGDMCFWLYFVDEGQLKMFYCKKDEFILFKILGFGDIFGEDIFFFLDGFCMVFVVVICNVKLCMLFKCDFGKLKIKVLGFEFKFNDYCLNLELVVDLLKVNKFECCLSKCFNLIGQVSVQMLDQKGKLVGKLFKMEFLDILVNGLVFLMKMM